MLDIDIHEIDTRSREGQRLRGELLVKLKEGAGLNSLFLNVDEVVDQQINFLNDKILLLIPVR